jgi:hypothetical protein
LLALARRLCATNPSTPVLRIGSKCCASGLDALWLLWSDSLGRVLPGTDRHKPASLGHST